MLGGRGVLAHPRSASVASRMLRRTGTTPDKVARTIALVVDDLGLGFRSMSTGATPFTSTSTRRSSRGISSPSAALPVIRAIVAVHRSRGSALLQGEGRQRTFRFVSY